MLPSDAKSAAENHFKLIDGIQNCEIQFERAATCSIMFLFLFFLFRSLPLLLLLFTVALVQIKCNFCCAAVVVAHLNCAANFLVSLG